MGDGHTKRGWNNPQKPIQGTWVMVSVSSLHPGSSAKTLRTLTSPGNLMAGGDRQKQPRTSTASLPLPHSLWEIPWTHQQVLNNWSRKLNSPLWLDLFYSDIPAADHPALAYRMCSRHRVSSSLCKTLCFLLLLLYWLSRIGRRENLITGMLYSWNKKRLAQ